jgi:hypothetical protein
MRQSIAHTLTAFIHALFSVVLPARGRHRRGDEQPFHLRYDHPDEPTPNHCAEPVDKRKNPEPSALNWTLTHRSPYAAESVEHTVFEDESDPVRWYVVLAQSAAWLSEMKAERQAQRVRRIQALEAGDGIEVVGGVPLPPTEPETLAA